MTSQFGRAHTAARSLALALLISVFASAAIAQVVSWDPQRVQTTRPELEALLQQLRAAANSDGYSSTVRNQAAQQAAMVEERLRDGDFQVGDRVVLNVRREESLTDTFTVRLDRSLDLPLVGAVPLVGVLRSELEPHLREQLGRYIRDPELSAHALVRVAVMGQVNNPGFLLIRPESPIAELVASAGGATREADLGRIHIERETRTIWEGTTLQAALAQGRTIDQLGLRAGDRLVMPERSTGIWRTVLLTAAPILSLVIAVSQLF
jgi:protein involved in polysaccharide export with SLBB domain